MPRRKHVPQRTCVACRQKKDKRRLTRLVNSPEQGVVVDPTGKLRGRGAYLCDDAACWDMALRGRLLDQALRTTVTEVEKQAIVQERPQTVPAADA